MQEAAFWVRNHVTLVVGTVLMAVGAMTSPTLTLLGGLVLGMASLQWLADFNGYAVPRLGWTPILRWSCWESPLAFAVRQPHRLVLFWRDYEPAAGAYATAYSIYELPSMTDADVRVDWAFLPQQARRSLGSVAVAGLRFRHLGCSYVSAAQVESALSV